MQDEKKEENNLGIISIKFWLNKSEMFLTIMTSIISKLSFTNIMSFLIITLFTWKFVRLIANTFNKLFNNYTQLFL